jgi:hypothetical protein
MKLSPDSHNYIRVSDIIRVDTGATPTVITSVTGTIRDSTGAEVSGSEISLTAVSGEADSYEGTFPQLALTVGQPYRVRIVIVADGSTVEIEVEATVTRL